MLVGAGKPSSRDFVKDVAAELDASRADISLVKATAAGLTGAVRSRQDEEAAERLQAIATEFEQRPDVTNIDKAYVLNQLQMVFHILERTDEAIALQERVVEMARTSRRTSTTSRCSTRAPVASTMPWMPSTSA
jgi:hypothetical protein